MTVSIKEILDSLPVLDRKALEQIKNRCTFLLQNSIKHVETLEDKDWLLEGIITVTRRIGLGNPSVIGVRNQKSFRGFSRKSLNVREYIEQFMPEDFTHIEYLKLGEICTELLAEYMKTWNDGSYTLSFEKLMFHVQEVPAALEADFPGYLADGMISFLVRRKFPSQKEV